MAPAAADLKAAVYRGLVVFAPIPILAAIVLATLYVIGVARVRRTGRPWPVLRLLSFLAVGIPLLLFATCGPPAYYAHTSFLWYMTMIVTLALVTPIFLVWGGPVTLGRQALPRSAARWWSAWWDSRLVAFITYPLVGPLLLLAAPVAVVFTPLLLASLQHAAVLAAVQLGLVIVGVLATLPLSESESPKHKMPHAVSAFLAFFELIVDAIPGIVLAYTTTLVASGWYAVNGIPGGTQWAASDQRWAGQVLWIAGEIVDLPFLLLIVGRWMRADAEDARRIDAELDARDARIAAAKASSADQTT